MEANKCGHEWIISLTQQEEESDLDSALVQVSSDLLKVDNFSIYINKHFSALVPPTLINPKNDLDNISSTQAQHLLSKATPNKVRVTHAYGRTTSHVPVYHLDDVIGVLIIETEQALKEQTCMMALHILNIYANQLWLLHKSRLDPLTELLNRQTFDKKVMEIVSGNGFLLPREDASKKRGWYLAIVDIDLFKNVNDNFGHVVGDKVISQVAKLLRKSFRVEDYVFRYGGEEFAILFQAKTHVDAYNALNRLRTNIAKYSFVHIERLTISIGFLELQRFDTVSRIVNQADLALYHSKKTGRNKVTACSELELYEEELVTQSY
ncbi:GGDEF domain-containing protein [Pseudoalteromonas sp. SWXJZ94C]|uniref:GGDEF domain-containing protein n=1 Tax=Pseudoalteromonas sp. SWXJZ94C TaxID=2792065 RepID=UPI0018CD8EC2|nr:GGDEF domain-containing protein [Pseudoalteromonas sp. SWXJZ94C]MBH0057757.1 GGDEF domain-containing protein [Pseudoalteromonas sp. SWXJZ94C]